MVASTVGTGLMAEMVGASAGTGADTYKFGPWVLTADVAALAIAGPGWPAFLVWVFSIFVHDPRICEVQILNGNALERFSEKASADSLTNSTITRNFSSAAFSVIPR